MDLNRKERLHEVHIMARVTRLKSDRVQNMTSQTKFVSNNLQSCFSA